MSSETENSSFEQRPIQPICYLESIEQLEAIVDPIRYRMCLMLTKPRTGAQLARALGISRARAHYHLNALKDVGLVTFCGERTSPHGIVEKYYQAIAEYLDFSRLLPSEEQTFAPDETTLKTFGAAIRFIANLLDFSREGITRLKAREGLGIGFHYTLNSNLTVDQFRFLRKELKAIKDRIIEMEHENHQSGEDPDRVNCQIMLFLTPLAQEPRIAMQHDREGENDTDEESNTDE